MSSNLKPGDNAPDFALPDDSGTVHHLSDYRGKAVIVYFYPKDDTPGCTSQACAFRDNLSVFNDSEAVILGISRDSVASHAKFRDKYKLNFPLLSDADGAVCERYGVWQSRSMYGKTFMGIQRATFLIHPDGTIAHIWPKVSVTGHADEVIKALRGL